MKNLLLCLLLPCLFLLGNTSFANDGILEEDTVVEGVILIGKTGSPICTFSIPEKYYGKDGELILSFEIVITKNNKVSVLSIQSKGGKVLITNQLSGTYYISIKIGDFYDVQKIVI